MAGTTPEPGPFPGRLRSVPTADLSADELDAVRRLLVEAFAGGEDGEFDHHDWDHTLGGVHVLWVADGPPDLDHQAGGEQLVGHAAVVCRRLMTGSRTWRCGYVESVVVRSDHRRRGVGDHLMAEVERLLAGYELGALGATAAGRPLYERRGWQVWRGPLSALTPDGVLPTADDEGAVMVRPGTEPPDLDAGLTCDWRTGDLW